MVCSRDLSFECFALELAGSAGPVGAATGHVGAAARGAGGTEATAAEARGDGTTEATAEATGAALLHTPCSESVCFMMNARTTQDNRQTKEAEGRPSDREKEREGESERQ